MTDLVKEARAAKRAGEEWAGTLPARDAVKVRPKDWHAICHYIDALASRVEALEAAQQFDLVAHLRRHIAFSEMTFGPGARVKGVVDHIRKELVEIEADPGDLEEWIDVIMLAIDGAWRSGATPAQIIDTLVAKQAKNEARVWPDWRTADPDRAIEHDRSHDAPPPSANGDPQQ